MDHSTVLVKAFLVFIIWDMGGDEISAGWLSKDPQFLITVNLRVRFTP